MDQVERAFSRELEKFGKEQYKKGVEDAIGLLQAIKRGSRKNPSPPGASITDRLTDLMHELRKSLLLTTPEANEEAGCCVCGRLYSACAKPFVDPTAYPDEGEWFCSKECNEAYHKAEGDYEKARALLRGEER